MDLIQRVATVALLVMLIYFVMVNIIDSKSGFGGHGLGAFKTTGKIIDTSVGTHNRTILGPVAAPGGENVTQLSVYDENQKGVLPSNHNPSETPVDFNPGITDVSQFYRNNPEVFDRTMTSISDVDGWNKQSQEMYSKLVNQPNNQEINPWNFEKDPLT